MIQTHAVLHTHLFHNGKQRDQPKPIFPIQREADPLQLHPKVDLLA